MVFRMCSIGGKIYTGDPEALDADKADLTKTQLPDSEKDKSSKEPISLSTGSSTANVKPTDSTSKADPTPKSSTEGAEPESKAIHHFRDEELQKDLQTAVQADSGSELASHARNLNGFFSVLALCHTVLTNIDKETGQIEYKAQSPDESALVQAAADMGFVFRGREREILYLQTPFGSVGDVEESSHGSPTPGAAPGEQHIDRYELLNILEFTSARKRMSVVVRKLDSDDGRLFLLTKGADNVIFERLKKGVGEELKMATERHLDEFAGQGLRTLTLAYKIVGGTCDLFQVYWTVSLHFMFAVEQEYASWNERYHEATVALDEREEKIEAISDELEQDLRLLGATAIEDRLQDGVPEAIADLKAAGIKVWVATGDKLETAIGELTPFLSS